MRKNGIGKTRKRMPEDDDPLITIEAQLNDEIKAIIVADSASQAIEELDKLLKKYNKKDE